ncbi:MAG: alpha/beta hydrolase [Alphaproteobacteria bacterium]|nr:alpha/beta hydrolase [Alphaproteobacteria bacterium]
MEAIAAGATGRLPYRLPPQPSNPAMTASARRQDAPFVHPEMAKIIAWYASLGLPDTTKIPLAEARPITNRVSTHWNWPKPDMETVDLYIPGPTQALKARLFKPRPGKLPVLLYLHGGGWVFCDLDTHDRLMRMLALESGCAVLGLDYRLAPENPFPAGHDDAMAAVAWIRSDGAARGLDPSRIAVAGDSAGANLSLGVLVGLHEKGLPQIQGGALFYGCLAPDHETESHKAFGGGAYNLTTERMRWFWKAWLGGTPAAPDIRAAPLLADMKGLPKLYLNAASLDPLLDDTLRLAEKLKAAKVPHKMDIYDGVIHGFMNMSRELVLGRKAVADAGRAIGDMLKA